MKPPRSLSKRTWIVVLLCAAAFAGMDDHARIQHVLAVTELGAGDARSDPSSPTGWADGKRWMILPEPAGHAYESIDLTQQMLSRGEWRIRRIGYEDAPTGRPVYSATPYRWWLALLAEIDHPVSGRPLGQSVERAALVADPLLLLLLLASAGLFVARRFGAGPASLLIIGLATAFPFASAFFPAVATDYGLVAAGLFWSLLLLVADAATGRRSRVAHFLSGAAGGFALWLSVTTSAPILLATVCGAVLLAVVGGRRAAGAVEGSDDVPPWRSWGAGGAIACLLGYVLEYFPSHAGWDLRVNHPLYGLAWLGIAELLHRLAFKIRTGKWSAGVSELLVVFASLCAIAPLAYALYKIRDWQFIAGDLGSTRLSNLPDAPVAESFLGWIRHSPNAGLLFATLMPTLLFVPAIGRLFSRRTAAGVRGAIAVALVPALVALALSLHHLRWWTAFDGAALVLLVATITDASPHTRWTCVVIAAAASGLGIVALRPGPALQPDRPQLSHAEVRTLYERALAHWIADHAGPDSATVLAPPLTTANFRFFGGLRGLGTTGWQNRNGLSTAFRIASSTRTEDTYALLNKFRVTYIVLPSWDTTLETMASLGVRQVASSFVGALHLTAGAVFRWLRPLPYNPPPVSGFENSSVLVFQVADEANPAVVQSRVLEYLVEMHHMEQAAVACRWLQRYPADIGAQVALAQYAKAAGNEQEFARLYKSIDSYVQVGADRRLPWDRRISLAVVLAIGGNEGLARAQVGRCLKLLNERRVRELTTGSLYHLMFLARHFHLEISDPDSRALAAELLPAELRRRLRNGP